MLTKAYLLSKIANRSVLLAFASATGIFLLVLFFAHQVWQGDITEAQEAFWQEAIETTDAVEAKLRTDEQLINALAVIVHDRGVKESAKSWASLTEQLVGEVAARRDGPTSLSLLAYRPLNTLSSKRIASSDVADFSASLLSVEPDLAGQSMVGREINSDSIRREALEWARDNGRSTVTSPLILTRDHHAGSPSSFLLIAPVYQGAVPTTVAARRAQIKAYVVAAYRMRDLLSRILPRLASQVALKVSDATDEYEPLVYFASDRKLGRQLFKDRHGLIFANRIWRLDYESTLAYEQLLDRKHFAWISSAGLLLALIVAVLVWRLSNSWVTAESRVLDVRDELRESEERLRHVISATNDGVWERDLRTGVYTYVSPHIAKFLGNTTTEENAATWERTQAAIHPDDLPLLKSIVDAHLTQGNRYDAELRMRHAEGHWVWMRVRGEAVRDANGVPVRMVGSLSDISETKEAEIRLHRYHVLLRTVLDVIPEPVLVKDKNFRILMANQAYAQRAGVNADDVIGKTTRDLLPKAEAELLQLADQQVFETGKDQVFEVSMQDRSRHQRRIYIVTKRLAHDSDGEPIMVGIHNDVTDLRRSLAQFEAVIEETPLVAVQGVDRNGVVTHWNRASEDLFGLSRNQALGSRFQDMVFNRHQQRRFEMLLENIWQTHEAFGPREIRLVLPNRRRLWLLVTVFPVIQDGRVIEVFGMSVDVTERHEARDELAHHRDHLKHMVEERTAGLVQATERLEEALLAKSEFLANMSHELRTPMHAILSFAQLGRERVERGPVEKLRDYFSRISTSGERLLLLINDLLDLSKLESGKMLINPVKSDVRALIVETVSELESLIDGKHLHVSIAELVSPLYAEIDPQRFTQVLHNLLSNAIKFSPESGHINISLAETNMPSGRRATDFGERTALWLIVEDEGKGIPPAELEVVFDKFVQSSKTRSGAGGTGLGLSICREIVHAHKGRISARNRPQGGAAFDVLIPVHYETVSTRTA